MVVIESHIDNHHRDADNRCHECNHLENRPAQTQRRHKAQRKLPINDQQPPYTLSQKLKRVVHIDNKTPEPTETVGSGVKFWFRREFLGKGVLIDLRKLLAALQQIEQPSETLLSACGGVGILCASGVLRGGCAGALHIGNLVEREATVETLIAVEQSRCSLN